MDNYSNKMLAFIAPVNDEKLEIILINKFLVIKCSTPISWSIERVERFIKAGNQKNSLTEKSILRRFLPIFVCQI